MVRSATTPKTPAAAKLRPIAHMAVYDGDVSGFAKERTSSVQPLALISVIPPQLLFMRVHNDALLLSKLPNAEPKQCARVLPFGSLKAVRQLSKHAFEIVLKGAPPVRLEAHDTFACKQWLQLLGPMLASSKLQQDVDMHAFPTRSVSAANLSPRMAATASSVLLNNPRMMRPLLLPPVAPNPNTLEVQVALTRRWHINTGQHGLAHLRRFTASPR
jgi:hypothetical protein